MLTKDMAGSHIDESLVQGNQFSSLRVCVIIPTFNNAGTLATVIEDVSRFTRDIIVINDGSSDDTRQVIGSFPFIHSFSYPRNKGKGWAIRQGFRLAAEKGYAYAVTIDSDGQHFAKDLPAFINALQSYGSSIIIGARNMQQDTVPARSSFGHRFSNFWFRVETGIALPDTQSGYRLYPILPLRRIRFFTVKYEFEIEVLVRAAWSGIPIHSIPVEVYYPPPGQRVTHFRPFKDFTRISILNTFLVVLAFLYIKPRDFLRSLVKKKNRQEMVRDLLLNPEHSDFQLAASIGLGVFMGIVPIWGFQLVTAVFLSFLFRLNKPLVILAANISVPPMIPPIIFASYKMGAYWMRDPPAHLSFDWKIGLATISQNLQQYLYGSITLAAFSGVFFFLGTFLLFKKFRRKPAPAL